MPPDEIHVERPRDENDKFPVLNQRIDDMQLAGMQVTNMWRGMWQTAMRYTWSQQLDSGKLDLKDDWDYIVINKIYPLMMQNVAKLAKNDPKVLTFPWSMDKGIDDYVQQWAGILQYLWESQYELAMRTKLIKGLLDCGVFGYMVGKTFWEPRCKWSEEEQDYMGNVNHEFVHPALFWSDPDAERVERGACGSCGTRRKVALEWAQKRWAEHAKAIESYSFTSNDPQFYEDTLVGFQSDYGTGRMEPVVYENQRGDTVSLPKKIFSYIANLLENNNYHKLGGPNFSHERQRYVYVEEVYFDDQEEREHKITDNLSVDDIVSQGLGTVREDQVVLGPDGQPFTTENWPKIDRDKRKVPRYPYGRAVQRIGRVVLNPLREDQVYRESRWPFTIMPYHILPHMWQGTPASEMVRSSQDMLNLSVSSLIQRARLAADPERVVETGALARDRKGKLRQTKEQMKGIGKWIVVRKGAVDKIKNMVYPPLDPAEMVLVQTLSQNINDNMFMQPVARGAPSQVTGGKDKQITATEAAKQDVNSHDYTAMQAIFLDQWIDQTLTLVAEIVQAHYTEGRITRIVGNGKRQNIEISQDLLDVRFDVNIEPGSTLPFDEERKKQDHLTAFQILANPAPNPMLEQVLRDLGVNDIEDILAQHQGTVMLQQLMQLSQQMLQVDPAVIEQVVAAVPQLQPLFELMAQLSQLAGPAEGQGQPQGQAEQERPA